jgi:hypothetical protein
VDPETGATTNHIESVQRKFKMKNKKRYGTDRIFLNNTFLNVGEKCIEVRILCIISGPKLLLLKIVE